MEDNICRGKLENDLSYYISKMNIDCDILHIELLVKAGSIADRKQKGTAHLLEHINMSFVKYKVYPNIKYHASAHTDYYCTRYIFTITKANLDKVLYMIQNILSGEYLETKYLKEIKQDVLIEYMEKEKNIDYQVLKKLFKDSIFFDHLPVGDMEIVNSITFEEVKKFFETWYVPEISAIIVMGDIDIDYVLQKVKNISFLNKNPKVESCNRLLKGNIPPIKQNFAYKSERIDFFYILNLKENIKIKELIYNNYTYDFSLDLLEKLLKNNDNYSLGINNCHRTVISPEYELLYFNVKDNKKENNSFDKLKNKLNNLSLCFLELNFVKVKSEYIDILNHFENNITITDLLNRCMDHFVYNIPIVSYSEEKDTAINFIMNLEFSTIADCIKNIWMESTVICI